MRAAEAQRARRVEEQRLERARGPRLRPLENRRTTSASRDSATCTPRGTNWSPRSSGMRITAASTPSSRTSVSATAARVESRESVCANEREIS